jgi:hypothetical protein
MKPTISVVRAIGAEFAKRMLKPILTIGVTAAAVLLSVGGWLTTQSAWWWIMEAVFILGSLLFAVLVVVARIIISSVGPTQSRSQKQAVGRFVDKLERVAEHLQTPQFVILYRVIRDIVRPRPGNFIETVSRDSKTLAPDFNELRKQFEA